MSLFKMRYRKPFGVADDLIDAKNLTEAEAIGRVYCDKEPGFKYIGVAPAVIATAAILGPEADVKDKARVGG